LLSFLALRSQRWQEFRTGTPAVFSKGAVIYQIQRSKTREIPTGDSYFSENTAVSEK
jgi:hypothetical protein